MIILLAFHLSCEIFLSIVPADCSWAGHLPTVWACCSLCPLIGQFSSTLGSDWRKVSLILTIAEMTGLGLMINLTTIITVTHNKFASSQTENRKKGKKEKENYKFLASAPAKLGKARQSKTMFVICSSLESEAKRKSFLLV